MTFLLVFGNFSGRATIEIDMKTPIISNNCGTHDKSTLIIENWKQRETTPFQCKILS